MALARAAHVTRSASAFGPHGRRRRRTGVHPKAQLRLTGNPGRIADDAARLEIGETKELTERRVGHLLPCHRGTPGAWRTCPQSRASACRSFGRLRAPQGPCLGALSPPVWFLPAATRSPTPVGAPPGVRPSIALVSRRGSKFRASASATAPTRKKAAGPLAVQPGSTRLPELHPGHSDGRGCSRYAS